MDKQSGDVEMSAFLKLHLNFENDRVFYEFPKAGMDLSHYREVIEVPSSKVCDICGRHSIREIFYAATIAICGPVIHSPQFAILL